ncbi:MAG: T9SS type A sorting domain-containing protein [Saprospiraceae bacterium]
MILDNKMKPLKKFTCLFLFFLQMGAIGKIIAQSNTIILGRPTDKTITASVLFDQKVDFYIEFGTKSGDYPNKTSTISNLLKTPDKVLIEKLSPNTKYYYRLQSKLSGAPNFTPGPEYSFHTQRSVGESFSFTIEADEHLYDKKGVRSLYQITLANQLKDNPDFMISLGDTFGDDHTPAETTSADMEALHKDYLQYLGKICHSVPFFFCLGNHEGENGYYLKQNPPNNIAVYGSVWRKFYYPNPYPNTFYSGNMNNEGFGIGQPENYYAFEWGDALFVILDVYRHCDVNEKPQKWDWTLGKTQYDWLKSTLEDSKSKYKFVFAHHTRGQGRGGVGTAKGYEWGGYNGDSGSNYQFDIYRPGWGLPIHQLMKKNGVNIFFQGHDHLFAKEELDGLVYQEVPMPSDTSYQIGMLANADAYTDVTMDGSGHMRVSVSPFCVKVDYVKAYLPKDENGTRKNQQIGYSYTVGSCVTSTEDEIADDLIKVFPNPGDQMLNIQIQDNAELEKATLYNSLGQVQTISTSAAMNTSNVPDGIYMLEVESGGKKITRKIMIHH